MRLHLKSTFFKPFVEHTVNMVVAYPKWTNMHDRKWQPIESEVEFEAANQKLEACTEAMSGGVESGWDVG